MAIQLPQERMTLKPQKQVRKEEEHNETWRGEAMEGTQCYEAPSPALPSMCRCSSREHSSPTREHTLQESRAPRSLLSHPAGFTALCQLKALIKIQTFACLKERTLRQLITSKGTLTTSIIIIVSGAITGSWRDSISWHQSKSTDPWYAQILNLTMYNLKKINYQLFISS